MQSVRTTALAAATVLTTAAHADIANLVPDQMGAPFTNAGYGGPVAQSFTAGLDTLAAIEVLISGTAVFTSGVTLSVYDTWDGTFTTASLSGLLTSLFLPDLPRNELALFEFETVVNTTPGTQYYFLLEFDSQLGAGAGVALGENDYLGGEIIFAGTSAASGDLAFTTFGIIPTPATGAPLALLAIAARRRR